MKINEVLEALEAVKRAKSEYMAALDNASRVLGKPLEDELPPPFGAPLRPLPVINDEDEAASTKEFGSAWQQAVEVNGKPEPVTTNGHSKPYSATRAGKVRVTRMGSKPGTATAEIIAHVRKNGPVLVNDLIARWGDVASVVVCNAARHGILKRVRKGVYDTGAGPLTLRGTRRLTPAERTLAAVRGAKKRWTTYYKRRLNGVNEHQRNRA